MADPIHIMTDSLVKNGYRLTSARRAIIQTLADSQGHITADSLARKVRQRMPQIGRMTVYRTLELLTGLGVIHPIYQGTGAASFILMPDGTHHHLICNQCHDVIEFDECTVNELAQQLAERYRFRVSSHLLEFHGVCENCLAS